MRAMALVNRRFFLALPIMRTHPQVIIGGVLQENPLLRLVLKGSLVSSNMANRLHVRKRLKSLIVR